MEIYIPNGSGDAAAALARTTHLAVGAHPDDIEFMAYDGILKCYDSSERFFTAVVVGDGAGSPRSGAYASYTDEEMIAVRRREQKRAADLGRYNALIFLDLPSSAVKDPTDKRAVLMLSEVLRLTSPAVVYTHNPADKHDTHAAAALRLISALRCERMTPTLYGCEVWRSLDWLPDSRKIAFDVGGNPSLELPLLRAFDSQIAGGKRYDEAVIGRRRANATFSESHGVDEAAAVSFAVDMTPLLADPALSVVDFITGHIDALSREVTGRLARLS